MPKNFHLQVCTPREHKLTSHTHYFILISLWKVKLLGSSSMEVGRSPLGLLVQIGVRLVGINSVAQSPRSTWSSTRGHVCRHVPFHIAQFVCIKPML